MEINTKDNIKMVNSMVKESIYGLMDPVTKDSSKKELGKVKAVGNQLK